MTLQNWLLTGGLAAIMAVLGIMLRVTYRIGGDAQLVAAGLQRITKIEEKLEKVSEHDTKITTLQALFERNHSDFKSLKGTVEGLRVEIVGTKVRQASRPHFNKEDED